jgi:Autotransporter beta-domain
MRVAPGVIAIWMCAIVAPSIALADTPARDGLSLGFGLGVGWTAWTWPDGEHRTEGSASGNLRVGWALRNDCLVGLEVWGWSKSYSIEFVPENVPARIIVWAATPAVTYFPGDAGFFVRGGVGVGQGRADVDPDPSVDFPASGDTHDTGLALLAEAGYEYQLTPHQALGAAAHGVYIALDEPPFDDVTSYGLTVEFNWYW